MAQEPDRYLLPVFQATAPRFGPLTRVGKLENFQKILPPNPLAQKSEIWHTGGGWRYLNGKKFGATGPILGELWEVNNVYATGQITKVNLFGNVKGHPCTTAMPRLTSEDLLNVVLGPNFTDQGTRLTTGIIQTTEITTEVINSDDQMVVSFVES